MVISCYCTEVIKNETIKFIKMTIVLFSFLNIVNFYIKNNVCFIEVTQSQTDLEGMLITCITLPTTKNISLVFSSHSIIQLLPGKH